MIRTPIRTMAPSMQLLTFRAMLHIILDALPHLPSSRPKSGLSPAIAENWPYRLKYSFQNEVNSPYPHCNAESWLPAAI